MAEPDASLALSPGAEQQPCSCPGDTFRQDFHAISNSESTQEVVHRPFNITSDPQAATKSMRKTHCSKTNWQIICVCIINRFIVIIGLLFKAPYLVNIWLLVWALHFLTFPPASLRDWTKSRTALQPDAKWNCNQSEFASLIKKKTRLYWTQINSKVLLGIC